MFAATLQDKESPFEPKTLRAGILIIDIVYGICDQLQVVVPTEKAKPLSDWPALSFAFIAFFGLGIAHLVTILIFTKPRNGRRCSCELCYKVLIGIFVFHGSCLYFIGDNLPDFVKKSEGK